MSRTDDVHEEQGKKEELLDKLDKVDLLLSRLDNLGLRQYVRLSQNVPKVLWLNFLSGIARGLGFTIGTAIVLAIIYKVIRTLIGMNIPYLTEMLENLVLLIGDMARSPGKYQ